MFGFFVRTDDEAFFNRPLHLMILRRPKFKPNYVTKFGGVIAFVFNNSITLLNDFVWTFLIQWIPASSISGEFI